jgi:hypothetical protein
MMNTDILQRQTNLRANEITIVNIIPSKLKKTDPSKNPYYYRSKSDLDKLAAGKILDRFDSLMTCIILRLTVILKIRLPLLNLQKAERNRNIIAGASMAVFYRTLQLIQLYRFGFLLFPEP